MRRLFVLLVFVLSACSSYITPDGGYAFDVSIRILPPVVQPIPTHAVTLTPSPTFDDPTPTSEFATPPPPELGRVTTAQLNVRSAPGVNNPSVGSLFLGNVVHVVGRNEAGTWLQVENEQGILLGWVSAAYIELYRG